MDLTYMPGELDMKNAKISEATNMKRDHDSVDDFEHLDPDMSPGDGHVKEKFGVKKDSNEHILPADSIEKSYGDAFALPSQTIPVNTDSGKISPDSNILTDFGLDNKQIKTEVDFHFDSEGKSSLLDFGTNDEDDEANKSFISAEIAAMNDKTEHETPILYFKSEISSGDKEEPPTKESNIKNDDSDLVFGVDSEKRDSKSMKEDDALPQYDVKIERKQSPEKDDYSSGIPDKEFASYEHEFSKPQTISTPAQVQPPIVPEQESDTHKDETEFINPKDFASPIEVKEAPSVEEPTKPKSDTIKPEPIATKPEPIATKSEPHEIKPDFSAKSTPAVSKENVKSAVKKSSISDLDDIIGPEDVFKRIGLDAWFTPERLHPKVEALVYWRDPKKSGVVFGGGMAILLSLCFMSLISVIAYTSLFALMGTICFRIYKNILQAVQKTSEGHPFKEFLDLELSLPQDKVREVVDTAVVHVNAAVVELRRLFLVEDLIDSIKFGVCLWCLTYVGAIFNGMTLVILAFVALFTVPKIYENNKASIDQYIELGRSKVAEITNKVKAAVPIGKKEPEKDKEQ